jgi:hypothetical protein
LDVEQALMSRIQEAQTSEEVLVERCMRDQGFKSYQTPEIQIVLPGVEGSAPALTMIRLNDELLSSMKSATGANLLTSSSSAERDAKNGPLTIGGVMYPAGCRGWAAAKTDRDDPDYRLAVLYQDRLTRRPLDLDKLMVEPSRAWTKCLSGATRARVKTRRLQSPTEFGSQQADEVILILKASSDVETVRAKLSKVSQRQQEDLVEVERCLKKVKFEERVDELRIKQISSILDGPD